MLCGKSRSFLKAMPIAVCAAMVDVIGHVLYKRPQTVFLIYNDTHSDGGRIREQAVPPGLVLLPRVNIGIIPERDRLNSLSAEGINTAQRARCTAGVH